ncbi:toprim domain-containing protein [Shewanella sp. 202IG2-18]|uniref:toprim domain-containing protein n=1 Tax=Parashewanella hymeniacidonis TaxID=2807618 RepID=UPI00195FC5C1|nr:toprim domain-containing protein [Parashewanella hymeniacidonis]MBM7070583.1 toprim domain-containing protein [Parashewanella hymeniacidonis]
MYPELQKEVLRRLPPDYDFKSQTADYLQQGLCPSCGKRELYTHRHAPWILRCGRLNKCGHEIHIKQVYPELFNSWSERFPATIQTNSDSSNTNTADAYLKYARGFDLKLIKDWYQQGAYYCSKRNIHSATIKFTLVNGSTWERLIDNPERFGSMKANFKGKYKGYWWQPPNFTIAKVIDACELWLTEGIFDAISLLQIGIQAVSVMSCNNFPSQLLSDLESKCFAKKKPTLIFAFDTGTAGELKTQQFVTKARELGWQATAAQPPKSTLKLDWNELLTRERLTTEHLEKYRYLGKLLVANSATEKAILIYNRQGQTEFPFEFNHCLYWFSIDVNNSRKIAERIADERSCNCSDQIVVDQAIKESSKVKLLCKCFPQALYARKVHSSEDKSYYFKIDYPHQNYVTKATFTGSNLSSSYEFKRRLLSITGAVYRGNTTQLDRLIEQQLYNIKQVLALDFIGYSVDHQCYIFNQLAVKQGRLYQINEEDFFDIASLSIKSLLPIKIDINQELKSMDETWFDKLWQAFGIKGMVALLFWFGSLFAEQIRLIQKTFLFLEITGEPGGGKTTLIEFMWKCCGRIEYEGFDPNRSSPSARERILAQVGNLPVVLSEADRVSNRDPKQARFDWEDLKMLYNGRATGYKGVMSHDNQTREPKFRGSILIEQNEDVVATSPILQRIVKLVIDPKHHTNDSLIAAEWLESVDMEDVSGFILKSILNEKNIMQILKDKMPQYMRDIKQKQNIRINRIAKNHAQLCALMDALADTFSVTQSKSEEIKDALYKMASQRQTATSKDNSLLETFWDVYDFLEMEEVASVNHSRDPKLIAISLNQFAEVAASRKQKLPELNDLRRQLKLGKTHRYIGQKTVNSAVHARLNKSFPTMKKAACVKCWIFKKGERK